MTPILRWQNEMNIICAISTERNNFSLNFQAMCDYKYFFQNLVMTRKCSGFAYFFEFFHQ